MKILIIGGAGFIGSHLCESYVSDHHITSLDNYISGKKENHIKGVEYLDMNSKDILSLNPEFNLIFHLGEYSRVEKSLDKIDFVLENNILPVLSVLQFAKKCKAKLMYAGSSTKYSDNGANKYKSPYAFSKWINSELVKFYCDINAMPYAITYFYNVYGGRENSEGEFATVIAKFLKRKKLNKKLQITKPGTQTRNFTHIEDTINALHLIAEKGQGDEYGIAASEFYSIDKIAKLISDDIEYTEENVANRQSSEILTKKVLSLGWKPKHKLLNYIKSNI
tara:strand:+ start:2788 stop:3624 length:837 start_codon:yes stop_codon:yes gene_type:complete